jgi:hypothetical protein
MKLCCDCQKVEIPKGNSKRCPDCRKQKNIEYDRGRKRDKHGYKARKNQKPYLRRTTPSPFPESQVPVIPPEDRVERLIQAKSERLGMPLPWVRDVWLRSEGGLNCMGQMP